MSERFLQLLRLLKSEGEVSLDETWGYTHAHMVLSDTHTVCDWSDVSGMVRTGKLLSHTQPARF